MSGGGCFVADDVCVEEKERCEWRRELIRDGYGLIKGLWFNCGENQSEYPTGGKKHIESPISEKH